MHANLKPCVGDRRRNAIWKGLGGQRARARATNHNAQKHSIELTSVAEPGGLACWGPCLAGEDERRRRARKLIRGGGAAFGRERVSFWEGDKSAVLGTTGTKLCYARPLGRLEHLH